jgi:transposase InsO family protein
VVVWLRASIGDCYDNAVIESLWSRMQTDLRKRRRRHAALGVRNPIEYEKMQLTVQPVA